MALNFPDSPTLNQVYTDTTSGFSYQWDGVVWQSYTPSASKNISIVDDISGSFNSSTQTFALAVSGTSLTPANAQQLRVVLGGIVQEPGVDYTVSGSDITFTTPPSALLDCSIVSLGPAVAVSVPGDGTVTPAKLSTGGPSWNSSGDLNVSGIVTATSFVGDGSGITGISSVSFATTSFGLSGTPNVTVGVVTATSFVGNLTGTATGLSGTPNVTVGVLTASSAAITGNVTVDGNVSIAGTLTYEDVTNVDSIGIVTARAGVVLGPTANTIQLGTGTTISSPASDTFTILTGGSERVRVSSAGSFGIGTANPSTNLHVVGSNSNLTSGYLQDGATTGYSVIQIKNTSGHTLAGVNGSSAGLVATNALPYSTVVGTYNNTSLHLITNDVVRVTVSTSGGLGVGTTVDPGSGAIYATGDITAFYSSDIRLKKDIEPITEPIKKLMEISGVTYKWNEEYLKDKDVDGYFVRETEVGVIAQDVEKVLPEVVATRENGYKAVRYEKLVALLIEAVKDQQHQIDELKARLEEK